MAFVLEVSDGTNSIDFMDPDSLVLNGGFNVGLARRQQIWASYLGEFGGQQLVKNLRENREAEIKFRIGGTKTEILQKAGSINTILENARKRYMRGYGTRVSLTYQWDGVDQATYFEIYDGEFIYPPDLLSVEKIHHKPDPDTNMVYDCELRLTVSPLGYSLPPGQEGVALPLSNGGAPSTNYVNLANVFNNQRNWVDIDGDDVPGDTPALLKLDFIVDANTGAGVSHVFVGHRIRPEAFTQILEGEDALQGPQYVATTVLQGGRSGGAKARAAILAETGDFDTIEWDIDPSDFLGDFRVFAWPAGSWAYEDVPVLFAIDLDGQVRTEFKKGGVYDGINPREFLDMGSLTIPHNNLHDVASLANTRVNLLNRVRFDDFTNYQFDLDFLSFLPIDGGYRIYPFRSLYTLSNGRIIDDPWNGVYMRDGSGDANNQAYGLLEPFRLDPGVDQKLYFVGVKEHGQSDMIDFSVKAWVYPTFETLAY